MASNREAQAGQAQQLAQQDMENRGRQAEGMEDVDPIESRKRQFRDKYASVTDIPALARCMRDAQLAKEDLEAQLKIVNAHFDVLRLEILPARCEDQGVEGMKIEGVGRLGLTADLNVSVKAGMKEQLFGWFKKSRLGDLIQPTVNASTLKAFVKDRIKAGKPIPDDLLNVNPFTRASITKG